MMLIKSLLPKNIHKTCQYYQEWGSIYQSHKQDTFVFPHPAQKTQKQALLERLQRKESMRALIQPLQMWEEQIPSPHFFVQGWEKIEDLPKLVSRAPFQESTTLLSFSCVHFYCEHLILLQNWSLCHNGCIWLSELILQTLFQRLLQPLTQQFFSLVFSFPPSSTDLGTSFFFHRSFWPAPLQRS